MKRLIPFLCVLIVLWLAGCQSGDRAIGESCTEKNQCKSGLCLQEERWGESTGWNGGYCTQTCSDSCSGSAVCVPFADDSYCMEGCTSDTGCRSGYVCNPLAGACLPDCRRGWDCGSGYSCNDNGYCVSSAASDQALGASCEESIDCLSLLCIPEQTTQTGTAWQGGICTQTCGDCPADFSCVALIDASYCLPSCSADSECRDGYVCNPQALACVPDCRLGWDCGSAASCNDQGYCGPPSG
jgi:hypothetical protein